ncbi:hypothetical protein [Pleionea sp. CnH1-48]|uniref:hypothetical protein n=1 Tax=Pleionea sp. CnH1-48 TaxID=2954494 RepID=UPI002097BA83|nr:hypothetical protein [Pleionea sp. CnH1-48]MCO7223711.1 hypothetical protein [Pleionea sp. CnH1-48]
MTLLKGGKNMGKTLLAIPSAGEPIPSEEKAEAKTNDKSKEELLAAVRPVQNYTQEHFEAAIREAKTHSYQQGYQEGIESLQEQLLKEREKITVREQSLSKSIEEYERAVSQVMSLKESLIKKEKELEVSMEQETLHIIVQAMQELFLKELKNEESLVESVARQVEEFRKGRSSSIAVGQKHFLLLKNHYKDFSGDVVLKLDTSLKDYEFDIHVGGEYRRIDFKKTISLFLSALDNIEH